ncbi:MAG: hypothetical protein ABJA50_00950 [Chloroflexota bacterium]
MTVRVAAEQPFRLNKADMASYAQDVLSHDPLYKRVSEGNNGTYFSAVVQPNVPLMLGTDMTVTLDESDGITKVQVSTLSQPLIMGDVFGMYNRYMTEFFRKLNNAVKAERHTNLALNEIYFSKTTSGKREILAFALIVVTLIATPALMIFVLHWSPMIAILITPLVAFTLIVAGSVCTSQIKRLVNKPQAN